MCEVITFWPMQTVVQINALDHVTWQVLALPYRFAHESCNPHEQHMWTIMHILSNIEMHMGKALEVRPRKSTNVTLPPEILDRAKELGINLSRASERGVREEIQETEARRWANENADLVAAYTAMVDRDGLPLAKHRTF